MTRYKTNKAKAESELKRVTHPVPKVLPTALTAINAATRLRRALPRMQNLSAVAPLQYPPTSDPTDVIYHSRVEEAGISIWNRMDGFSFSDVDLPFLDHKEMDTLAASFGFLIDKRPDSYDNFTRLLIGLFNRMLLNKHAYAQQPVAKAQFFAFVRMEHYNSLLGRFHGDSSKPKMARALASVDVNLLMKITEMLIRARHTFVEKQVNEKGTAGLTSQIQSSLTLRETGSTRSEVSGKTENRSNVDNNTDMPKDSKDTAMKESTASEGNKWSGAWLKKLSVAIDNWTSDDIVRRTDKQCGNEWEKAFGSASATESN